ncbi:TniB family NTP-binding protein, partial [Psychrobacter sp.]
MKQEIPYTHIHPKFRHIALLPNEERLRFIDEPRWIGYDKANQSMETLQGLMNKVKQHRMPNLMIIGDSNNGKTTLINQFHKKFGLPYIDDFKDSIVPVVLIQAPPSPSEKELYISLLERLALPYRSTEPTTKLRYQVIHAFRCCNVKMLVIDEIHSLLTGTARQQRQIMNVIKFLCNELQMPIVVAGTRDAVRVLHTDQQHISRFDVIELENWNNNVDFRKLVGSFERVIPLKKPSNLTHPDKLRIIHSISKGRIGDVRRLISECAIEAITSGSEEITSEILSSR